MPSPAIGGNLRRGPGSPIPQWALRDGEAAAGLTDAQREQERRKEVLEYQKHHIDMETDDPTEEDEEEDVEEETDSDDAAGRSPLSPPGGGKSGSPDGRRGAQSDAASTRPESPGDEALLLPDEEALIPEEVMFEVLDRTIKRDVIKTRRYRVFPFYILFILLFSLQVGLEQLSSDDRFHMTDALRNLLKKSSFDEVTTVDEWYDWLTEMTTRVWQQKDLASASTPLDRNIPLGFVLIRQWRVKPQYCTQSPQINILSTSSKSRLPVLCYGDFSGDSDTSPFGPQQSWQTVSDLNYSVKSISVEGQLHEYTQLSDAFPIYLYINSTYGSVSTEIHTLKAARFIDSSTRAVVIDMLFFNPNIQRFQLYHLLTEIDSTGDLVQSAKSGVFRLLKIGESHLISFYFALDIFIFLGSLVLLVDLWLTVKNHYLLYDTVYDSINFWEIYMLAVIVLLMIRGVLRFWLWAEGSEIGGSWIADNAGAYGGDDDRLMFQHSCDYLSKQRLVLIIDAWVAVLIWLRIFEYLQFNERLNLVTETIVNSIGQLVAMFVIFFIIVIGFSIAGRIFYGHAMYEFRSFFATFGYLIRLVLSADLGDYLDLEKIRPVMTPIFIMVYFSLTWLVLLNMVLAIIAGSFQQLQENVHKQKSWSPAELWEDVQKANRRFVPHFVQKWFHKRSAGARAPPMEDPVGVRLRLIPVLRMLDKEEKKRTNEEATFITKVDFLVVASDYMQRKTAEKIYSRAVNDITGSQEKSFKLGERFAFHLNKRLRTIEGRIRGQQPNIDRIPEIEKASVRQHIINLQPKVDRLTELQEDIRHELFDIHHNLPTYFLEMHSDFDKHMAALEKITSERVSRPLQDLTKAVVSGGGGGGGGSSGSTLVRSVVPLQRGPLQPPPQGRGGGALHGEE